ncbi:PPP4R2 domain protein [Colletotrichum tofieldiae]|uniref:PPP4R2 domain protein n=1 Tax=Colletotrichum tofieldiae TaxID=708197 RepID=A0A166RES8_9PEZI|nr:PPP4R2 domain protein [Colletotrichum tofieldiae]
MEIEVDEDLLRTVATGGQMDYGLWPALSQGIISRLDKIAHNEFPIPNLPTPPQPINASGQQPRLLSPLPSSSIEPASSLPSSQDADKENSKPGVPSSSTAPAESEAANAAADVSSATAAATAASGSLPAQIAAMLDEINSVLSTFPKYPPHTIQRLAELVLEPRRHYRHLASYLHAVDRVVHVTSGASTYPLPPAIPDMSTMTLLSNGSANGQENPAAAVAWSNSTNSVASTVGTDEALGGALLTPIPWLTRRPSPGSSSPASSNGGGPAEIRTESTETIDGPNGVGSIETVSVSVNGIPSMGASSSNRAITQGELLRQEQEQGVVPVNQLVRQAEEAQHAAALRSGDGGRTSSPEKQEQEQQQQPEYATGTAAAEEENEVPHARGPEEIGVGDLGPQSETTSFVGGGPGVEMQGIDVEAAVGRKAEQTHATPPPEDVAAAAAAEDAPAEAVVDDAASDTSATSHPKRDADEELDGLASKKVKEHEGDVAGELSETTLGSPQKEEGGKEEPAEKNESEAAEAETGDDEAAAEAEKDDAAADVAKAAGAGTETAGTDS